MDINESHQKPLPHPLTPRGDKQLLAMEEELDKLEQERETLESTKGGGWRYTFGKQVEGGTASLGAGGRWKNPGSWVADQNQRGRLSGGI